MARLLYTVDDLVSGVRSLLDELNQDSVNTTSDIIPSLNRGQQFGFDILARKYPEPILAHAVMTLSPGVNEYSIPEDAFEDRLLKVEMQIPSGTSATFREVNRISYRDISNYESSIVTNIPIYYCVIGRTIRFVSTPSGTYNARIWYLREPEALVLPQGRITHINSGARYVIVDAVGADLTSEVDQLGSYTNLIDGQTGQVKATLQIQNISEDKISFRSVPSRSTVMNRTIVGNLPSDLQQDDYLAAIQGTCVPTTGQPMSNFLVEWAVAEMTAKLGGDRIAEEEILKKFEQQVERAWVGREKQMRIQKRSEKWGTNTRRWWYE